MKHHLESPSSTDPLFASEYTASHRGRNNEETQVERLRCHVRVSKVHVHFHKVHGTQAAGLRAGLRNVQCLSVVQATPDNRARSRGNL